MISVIFPYTLKFGDFVSGYIGSLRRHERNIDVVSVFTGNKANYNYTAALNAGAKQARGEWLLFSNDDVLCQGKFAQLVEGLNRNNIYGMELRHKTKAEWGADVEYLYGWILLMHRSLLDAVGWHDEGYVMAGFDDIDYCWRAQQMGFGLQVVDLPFVHLADQPGGTHRRYTVDGYKEQMALSKARFLAKVAAAEEQHAAQQAKADADAQVAARIEAVEVAQAVVLQKQAEIGEQQEAIAEQQSKLDDDIRKLQERKDGGEEKVDANP